MRGRRMSNHNIDAGRSLNGSTAAYKAHLPSRFAERKHRPPVQTIAISKSARKISRKVREAVLVIAVGNRYKRLPAKPCPSERGTTNDCEIGVTGNICAYVCNSPRIEHLVKISQRPNHAFHSACHTSTRGRNPCEGRYLGGLAGNPTSRRQSPANHSASRKGR
jgi:hypothetical protein